MSRLLDELRDAIKAGEKTRYRISKETGISESQLCRLMSEETGLSHEKMDILADALGLEIVIRPKKRTAKKKRR